MAKILQIMTVLTIACNILQVGTTTADTRQSTTETQLPSSTASRSTDSISGTFSASTPTSASTETNPTSRTSTETSLHPTSTSSQSHTSSHDKITSTDQTKTDSVSSQSSGTTTLRSTELVSVIPSLSSTEDSGKSPVSPEKVNTTQSSGTVTASSNTGDSLAKNPGLVAILCIFFIILALLCVIMIAKLISSQKSSQFERLDEVPMNKMNEDAPFARYPPK
ncbi:putative LOC729966 homolog isoform 1-T1 [Clarias gariepinus]